MNEPKEHGSNYPKIHIYIILAPRNFRRANFIINIEQTVLLLKVKHKRKLIQYYTYILLLNMKKNDFRFKFSRLQISIEMDDLSLSLSLVCFFYFSDFSELFSFRLIRITFYIYVSWHHLKNSHTLTHPHTHMHAECNRTMKKKYYQDLYPF